MGTAITRFQTFFFLISILNPLEKRGLRLQAHLKAQDLQEAVYGVHSEIKANLLTLTNLMLKTEKGE